MQLKCRAIKVQKAGNSPEENEDAFSYDVNVGRFAVADGATESVFCKLWADLLVRGFTDNPAFKLDGNHQSVQTWLKPLQDDWFKSVPWDRLQWFVEEKAKAGAFSTLLGLQLQLSSSPKSLGTWHAIAVGDTCLFQVRNNCLHESFPIHRATEFNNSPHLLSSIATSNKRLWSEQQVRFYSPGRFKDGDVFFLTTDALGQWILKEYDELKPLYQNEEKLWERLSEMEHPGEFQDFVNTQRQGKMLKNDDVTLMIIEVVPGT